MKQRIGVQLLKAVILFGGILGAVVASPILKAIENESQVPPSVKNEKEMPQKDPPQQAKTGEVTLQVEGMKRASDAEKIKKALRDNPGIVSATCDQKSSTCHVNINPAEIKASDVEAAVNKLGYRAVLAPQEDKHSNKVLPGE